MATRGLPLLKKVHWSHPQVFTRCSTRSFMTPIWMLDFTNAWISLLGISVHKPNNVSLKGSPWRWSTQKFPGAWLKCQGMVCPHGATPPLCGLRCFGHGFHYGAASTSSGHMGLFYNRKRAIEEGRNVNGRCSFDFIDKTKEISCFKTQIISNLHFLAVDTLPVRMIQMLWCLECRADILPPEIWVWTPPGRKKTALRHVHWHSDRSQRDFLLLMSQ